MGIKAELLFCALLHSPKLSYRFADRPDSQHAWITIQDNDKYIVRIVLPLRTQQFRIIVIAFGSSWLGLGGRGTH